MSHGLLFLVLFSITFKTTLSVDRRLHNTRNRLFRPSDGQAHEQQRVHVQLIPYGNMLLTADGHLSGLEGLSQSQDDKSPNRRLLIESDGNVLLSSANGQAPQEPIDGAVAFGGYGAASNSTTVPNIAALGTASDGSGAGTTLAVGIDGATTSLSDATAIGTAPSAGTIGADMYGTTTGADIYGTTNLPAITETMTAAPGTETAAGGTVVIHDCNNCTVHADTGVIHGMDGGGTGGVVPDQAGSGTGANEAGTTFGTWAPTTTATVTYTLSYTEIVAFSDSTTTVFEMPTTAPPGVTAAPGVEATTLAGTSLGATAAPGVEATTLAGTTLGATAAPGVEATTLAGTAVGATEATTPPPTGMDASQAVVATAAPTGASADDQTTTQADSWLSQVLR